MVNRNQSGDGTFENPPSLPLKKYQGVSDADPEPLYGSSEIMGQTGDGRRFVHTAFFYET